MKNSLKNKIKYDYEQGTEMPSSDLWDKLDAKLDASENKIVPAKTVKINWWKYAAALLCLITLGIIFKYSIQDDSTKIDSTKFTKVETPVKADTPNQDSLIEVQKNEIQPVQNQKLVENQNPAQKVIEAQKPEEKLNNNEKFTSNPQKLIKNKKEESQNPDIFIEPKVIANPMIQKEEKQIIANNSVIVPLKKSHTQYVKADELLFGRELQKVKKQVATSKNKLQDITNALVQKITPSSVSIFGITVYSEEETSN